MSQIHDRMPVILEPKQWDEGLDPAVHETEQTTSMLKPYPPEWLESVDVSTLVNSPRNNRAEVVEAMKAPQ